MPAIKYNEIKRLYECDGPHKTVAHFAEALKAGHLKAADFSIRELAEALIPDGREYVRLMDPRHPGGFNVLEANFAVDTTAFSNITGQIVYSEIMRAYEQVPNTISSAIPTRPTRFNGEKIPGVGNLGDVAGIVDEGDEYLAYGVTEDYLETPQTYKRGFRVPVTKEAVFFDRTGLVLDRCSQVGESMRTNREKRAIDCVIDSATGIVNKVVSDHRHKWKGTSYATFQATTPWVNLATSAALVDWTDLDADNQLWSNMTDPHTGEPIIVNGRTLLVCPELEMTARSILTATMWQAGDTTATAPVRMGPNLVSGYSLVSSPQLRARALADSQLGTTWYLGDFSKAFVYMENWPMTVVTAPPSSEDDFKRDIVAQYKVSERGSFFVRDPRFIIRNTVA